MFLTVVLTSLDVNTSPVLVTHSTTRLRRYFVAGASKKALKNVTRLWLNLFIDCTNGESPLPNCSPILDCTLAHIAFIVREKCIHPLIAFSDNCIRLLYSSYN